LPANDLLYKGAAHHRLDGWLLAGADEMLVNTVLHSSSSSSSKQGYEHNDCQLAAWTAAHLLADQASTHMWVDAANRKPKVHPCQQHNGHLKIPAASNNTACLAHYTLTPCNTAEHSTAQHEPATS
jgi:hypothetical protein